MNEEKPLEKSEKSIDFEGHRDIEGHRAAQVSINAFSRVIAVMILMMIPGVAGYFVDRWLATGQFVILGIVVGMILGTLGLLHIARQANQELRRRNDRTL